MAGGERRYQFSWELLGDISKGRPHLGPTTRVEVYRLMQFAFRDVLEQEMGTSKVDELFYKAGKLAGKEFYVNVVGVTDDFEELIRRLQGLLKELGIGILRMEEADVDNANFVISIAEDLDCSGLPELDYETCKYDEGFLAGILESFTGKACQVKEVDCWCTGDRTCRFEAKAVK